MPSQPTTAGIITDEASGERHIPESTRADGSTRRAIKIRPGYRPPEDVELYKNRTAENFRNRFKGGVPGAEGLKDEARTPVGGASGSSPAAVGVSAAANKNAKRREARKKAAAAAASSPAEPGAISETKDGSKDGSKDEPSPAPPADPVDPAADREKKARGLKKKLKQAKELKNKRDDGEALLPEQIAKVIRINELIRELDALGFDAEGEPKAAKAADEDKGK